MKVPEDLIYSKDHIWIRVEGYKATVGITEHAQETLGDILYVETPNPGDRLRQGEPFGVIESAKAVVDLIAPITGQVIETNELLEEKAEIINHDPYGNGWLATCTMDNLEEIEELFAADEYLDFLNQEGK